MTRVQKLPISVTLIAHNEEERLPRCLESIQDWVQEIIIVINNCTDKTREIGERFGALIYEHEWQGHRDQKNIALQYASQDWVLALDADEEVSPSLKSEIFEFINQDCNSFAGARFPRKVWFMGKWILHGDWYPDYNLRLFKNGSGKWRGSREHDKMVIEGPIKKLKSDLHHYSNPSLNHQIEKINYFSDIFLQRQLDNKKKWSAASTLFRAFWRFFRCYFIRLGFLDGYAGFYIASLAGFSTLVRYTRLYEYNLKHSSKIE
jgi:glycosyltransferase involved in cell wall biosynthesis